jgi:glutathione S-transferase
MIKLYTYPASSNSRKVRVVLLEKGLEFERVTIDLSKREQKSPEYLKIHPFGTVPALDDEGFIVYDSTIINEYLEDEYPDAQRFRGARAGTPHGGLTRQSLQSCLWATQPRAP